MSVTGSRAVGSLGPLQGLGRARGGKPPHQDGPREVGQWSSITVFADNVILKPTEMTVDELHAEMRKSAGALRRSRSGHLITKSGWACEKTRGP